MGRDKASLPVDGVPMAVRVATALRAAGAAEVVAVGGDPGALGALGLTAVADDPAAGAWGSPPAREASPGPLVGIATALRALPTDVVLVVACDLVAPAPEAMAATVAALHADAAADLAVPTDAGDRPQWLHAAWRQRARTRLLDALTAGERSVHGAVARSGLRRAPVTGLAAPALADADVPSQLPRRAD